MKIKMRGYGVNEWGFEYTCSSCLTIINFKGDSATIDRNDQTGLTRVCVTCPYCGKKYIFPLKGL